MDPKSAILKDLRLHRTKCSGIIKHILGPVLHDELLQDMKGSFFSLVIDESTDVSDCQCLGVMVRYFSRRHKRVITTLYRLIKLESVTADAITQAVLDALEKDGLPVHRLVGIGVDGASSMVGRHHSVSTLLKDKVPHLMVVRCLCHSLNLAASHACAVLPRHLDYLIRETHNWFALSPKRQREYEQVFKTLNPGENNIKIPKVAETRWLSRGKAVSTILDQYHELKMIFQLAKDRDRCYQAEVLYNMYNDPQNHLYLTFMSSQLKAIDRLNRVFQSANPDPCVIHKDLQSFVQDLLQQIVMPATLKGTSADQLPGLDIRANLIPARAVFLGHTYHIEEGKVSDAQGVIVREKCREFLVALAEQVQKRLPDNVAMLSDLTRLSVGPDAGPRRSISDIAARFSTISGDPDEVEREWVALHRDELTQDGAGQDREQFWAGMSEICMANGEKKYQHVSDLAMAILSTPVSNASVERLFSVMNVVKCKQRNAMGIDMLEAILTVRSYLANFRQSCVTYEVSDRMLAAFRSDVIYSCEWPEGL